MVSFNALRAQENKNRKWKCQNEEHNLTAPHSEEDCFKLHPEKLEAFRARKIGREKAKDSSPKIFATYSASAISSSTILDSGASYPMFKDSSRFVLVKGTQISLSLEDGSSITASGIGTTIILSNDGQPNYLQNSLVIPSISVALIALGPFLIRNCCLISKGDGVELVSSNGETLLTGSLTDRVVCVKLVEPKANHISCRYDTLAIHKALGHPSLQYATRMRPDIDFSSMPLECVHMDLCGPISPLSRGKNRYILQLVDGYLRYRFSYMLSQKSLAFEALKAFEAYAETQTNFRVRQVVTDNGGEFIGNNFKTLFENEGIECLLTAPHTPQQNPFSEQANRTLLKRTRCLLLDSKLDHSWWGEALSTAAYLLNRTTLASIGFKIPFSLFFGKAPKTENLNPFGCLVYININKANLTSKLSP
ncbi:hypothetical protein O181_080805 [Austropuccinia psidii MF-1]|uniref:Integrase catalytic domain-containing protein n=1 Tax=Austropuccinia psidii MF-1 TaxID=1389203 RepID=A0A9Q3IJ90_9BASI|nr:hypothetical protein [Austropuccinia psidii MF-1]